MPTSFGHSLAGVLLHESRLFAPAKTQFRSLLVTVLLANLADIDFLPGLLLGNPNRFHHGVTHSLGAALLVGLVFALLYKRRGHFWAGFGFATLVYASHVFLDFLTVDKSHPVGVPLFWPLSSEYFIAPEPIFAAVHKDSSTTTFLQSLFVPHNAMTVLREMVILGPITLFWLIRRKFIKFIKK